MAEEKEISLIDIIAYTADHIRKQKAIVISLFIVCLIVPIAYYFSTDKKLISRMSVTTNEIPFSMVEQICKPLMMSLKNGESALTGSLLNLPAEQVSGIKNLELDEIEQPVNGDKKGAIFTVEIVSIDRAVFGVLEESMLNFMNQNDLIKKITDVKRNELHSFHNKINQQIERLDSIQMIIQQAMVVTPKENVSWNDFNLGSVYQQMIYLKNTEMGVAEKLSLVDEFKSISGFLVIQQKRSLFFFVLVGIAGGIMLNVFYLLFMAIRGVISRDQAN